MDYLKGLAGKYGQWLLRVAIWTALVIYATERGTKPPAAPDFPTLAVQACPCGCPACP